MNVSLTLYEIIYQFQSQYCQIHTDTDIMKKVLKPICNSTKLAQLRLLHPTTIVTNTALQDNFSSDPSQKLQIK